MSQDKILGDDRRNLLLKWLKETEEPITGSDLANRTNVSRQVIVQDISLLKAKNEPIIATAQGYLYIRQNQSRKISRVVAVQHTAEEMERELNLIVERGVVVKDVIVEHPIYGEITANLHLKSRRDVDHFVSKMQQTGASLLSALTEGTHLHTLESSQEDQLDEVIQVLKTEGFLLT